MRETLFIKCLNIYNSFLRISLSKGRILNKTYLLFKSECKIFVFVSIVAVIPAINVLPFSQHHVIKLYIFNANIFAQLDNYECICLIHV